MRIELLEPRVLPSTFISVTSGNWNDPLTWAVSGLFDADGIPDANDAVFIGTATPQIVTIPTGFAAQADSVTIGALTYWALDAIKNRYLKAPGPLVQA